MRRSLSKMVLFLCVASAGLISACSKYKDEPGASDPRLSRKYCNDPQAVNYNFDFPGTEDNSVCYYPADAFAGSYLFKDSVYSGSNKLVRQDSILLQFVALSRQRLAILGFCSAKDSLHFTANRSLRAVGDTTILNGQRLCRVQDTVSGYITRTLADSSRLHFFLTVASDTGFTTHQGTAYRQ